MTANDKITEALQSLNLPTKPFKYTGNKTEYIIITPVVDTPTLHGDDVAIYDVNTTMVHYFSKCKTEEKKKEIRRLLVLAGFVINSIVDLYENDTGFNHVVFTVEIEQYVEY